MPAASVAFSGGSRPPPAAAVARAMNAHAPPPWAVVALIKMMKSGGALALFLPCAPALKNIV